MGQFALQLYSLLLYVGRHEENLFVIRDLAYSIELLLLLAKNSLVILLLLLLQKSWLAVVVV